MNDVQKYVEENIGTFHSKRLQNLEKLKLKRVLQRKNPYLFKAKNILTAQDLVQNLLDAYLSSQEETIFGDFLEGLAIFICSRIYDGNKSAAEGIDLEFSKDGIKYLVTIKSGPNWGNSGQIKDMKKSFIKAIKILNTNNPKIHVVAVNGCCYGRSKQIEKDGYRKLCGQRFWEFISGNENLYTEIIEPLGHKAKEKNEDFLKAYSKLINKFTFEFGRDFCLDGEINWDALVKFNSSIQKPK
ncbi:MAG: PmeII family type II restriction endonuclease [Candidatus Methanoperedens sp.]|nr:PmeII family type II restriction endonuclease [Candidatus Methanoperedens sp.]MCZ7370551.1 PmeII family type II restriction endonuclease [Candidatus Methanoperedens sp.]